MQDRAASPFAHALTVDLEDWFHASNLAEVAPRSRWHELPSRIEIGTRRLLAMFDTYGARATFFTLGWVADRFPSLLAEIQNAGHDIESHGYDHRLVFDLGPDAFRTDLRRSLEAIERVTGRRPRGFRAPSFSIDRRCFWAFDILAEEGIEYDSSIFPVHHPRYGIPRFPRSTCRLRTSSGASIDEVPMTTLRVLGWNVGVAGGAYLRILPLSVISSAYRSARRRREPGILYIHPWELDPNPPRVRIRGWGGLTHYSNLDRTEAKLSALLETMPWAPVAEVLASTPRARDPVDVASLFQ